MTAQAERGRRMHGVAVIATTILVLGFSSVARGDEVKVTLSGSQEIPPVTTSASGNGTVYVGGDNAISGKVIVTGMSVTVAHIHEGAPSTNGPIIIPLVRTSENEWSVPAGARLTDAQFESYKSGNLYFNIHSDAYKKGEIRGRIKP
ncbi:MAG TPA: CHRD domain-containing protein [Casimicrobiaceae bacterium]|nr:CHRD domain-containing protein [Casimicrobiaceae bacterium]